MATQSRDTNPEVEKVLISLLRKCTTAEKFRQVASLSSATMRLSKRAIQRANPHLSQRERDILFVKYHYGDELAERLRKYFEEKTT